MMSLRVACRNPGVLFKMSTRGTCISTAQLSQNPAKDGYSVIPLLGKTQVGKYSTTSSMQAAVHLSITTFRKFTDDTLNKYSLDTRVSRISKLYISIYSCC